MSNIFLVSNTYTFDVIPTYCQALSISLFLSLYLSLNLSLYLRDRDRAGTVITLPHHTTTPPKNFLRTLELTYTQVWYIIGIVSSSPTDFHSEKIGFRVTYDPPVSVRVNKYSKWLKLKCNMSLESSAEAQLISTQKILG